MKGICSSKVATRSFADPSNKLVFMKYQTGVRQLSKHALSMLVVAFALCCNVFAAPRAQTSEPQLPQNPADLVRSVIDNELKPRKANELYSWRQRDARSRGATTKLMIETPQGILSRIVAINDLPLNAEQRKKDDERINRLLDPEKMEEKLRSQKEDEDRTKKMLRTLPNAFIFKYTGNEVTPNGHTLVKISFTPNPDFNPPTRETLVFQGMNGSMILDATAQHIVKIDGTLFRDVSIGWGIIGRLDKGGRFFVEQADVCEGHWDQVKMILDFTGKALIFKNIRIKETDTAWDFKPVEKMSVAQALTFLRSEDSKSSSANNSTLGAR